MNQEPRFETIPLEWMPEVSGEMFEIEGERGIRRSFAGTGKRNVQLRARSGGALRDLE